MLSSSVDLPYSQHLASCASVTNRAVSSQTRTQHPTDVNLQSIFNAGSETLNISPQGNFVVNINCAGVRSEFDEFDTLVEDANLDL